MKVSVIGAGSWGSTIARMLGQKGLQVGLWARNLELIEAINTSHRNPRYLSDLQYPSCVVASNDLAQCLQDSEAVVMVTPSTAMAQLAEQMSAYLKSNTPVVLLTKGVAADGRLLLDVLAQKLGGVERLAVLSGPNLAEEVARERPSATVIASANSHTAAFFQELFGTSNFRVYTSSDVIGVQLSGAAKNIFAIACGLAFGLGFGDNTIAMLMTRGQAEISRLVVKLGGDPITCLGLAGMGDLIATCTSPKSRNRSFGVELAARGTLEAYQQKTHMVVEGAQACKTITDLAAAHNIDTPISNVVRRIVWDNLSPEEAVAMLMDRSYKSEFY